MYCDMLCFGLKSGWLLLCKSRKDLYSGLFCMLISIVSPQPRSGEFVIAMATVWGCAFFTRWR